MVEGRWHAWGCSCASSTISEGLLLAEHQHGHCRLHAWLLPMGNHTQGWCLVLAVAQVPAVLLCCIVLHCFTVGTQTSLPGILIKDGHASIMQAQFSAISGCQNVCCCHCYVSTVGSCPSCDVTVPLLHWSCTLYGASALSLPL